MMGATVSQCAHRCVSRSRPMLEVSFFLSISFWLFYDFLIVLFSKESKRGEETMEERLLSGSKSNINGASGDSSDVINPSGSSSATPVVVLSTLVALSGAFGYGCAIGYSSAAESGIIEDLGLTVAAYSVFGSLMTIGGMIGALVNGKITDLIGRRGVSHSITVYNWG
uniref:sugar transporter ERD6-like 5 n=1 Tax=Fragaria vesca subsp. vesca TaxID=101020 RepID=UPI0005CA044C